MIKFIETIRKRIILGRVLVYLTTSDVFTWGLMLVINAFVGLYLEHKLGVEPIQIVGIGTGIYSLANGLFQIPVGAFIDSIKKDKDDLLVLFTGNMFLGVPFLFFPHLQSEYEFYLLEFIIGMGAAMNLVSWRKTFAKNLRKNSEGTEYGIYETIMSMFIGLFSITIGSIANLGDYYFDLVMTAVGLIMISSGFWVLMIFKVSTRNV